MRAFPISGLAILLMAVLAWPAIALAQDNDGGDGDDNTAITDDAATAFGKEFELAVNKKLTALFDYLDIPTTIRRGVTDLDLPEEPLAKLIPELNEMMRPRAGAADAVVSQATLLRVLTVRDERVLRVRYIADGLPDYADYWLARLDGTIRIVDVLRHSRGARMSAQMRISVLGMLRQRGAEIGEKGEAELALFDCFSAVSRAMQQRNPRAARDLYDKLPEEVFTHPTLAHSVRTLPCGLALVEGGPEAYDAALKRVRETRGTDLALEAWGLSVLLGVGAPELAIPQIARVDALISDPWLDWCKAQLLVKLDRLPAAREAALQAVGRDAGLTDAWAWMLDEAVSASRWVDAVQLLTQFERATRTRPEDEERFEDALANSGLRASEDFQRWLRDRPAESDGDDGDE